MKSTQSSVFPILLFILAQIAWIALLALWIYRFILNKIILDKIGNQLSPEMISGSVSVIMLILGCILFIAVSIAMSFIFRSLTVQNRINKLYDTFIANITHELKSPLSSIQMYLETLHSKEVEAAKRKEFISIMLQDVERLNRLINAILEVAGLEKGLKIYNYNIYDLKELIKTSVENALHHFKLKEDSISININNSCKCLVDKDAFQIVIDNLVDNSIKYTSGPAKIDLSLRVDKKWIQINFRDYGPGIPENEKRKIFDRFYRITHPDITNVKGTGLGLYLTKEIIKNHKGKISILTPEDGKGTIFSIKLPVFIEGNSRFNKMLKK